MRLYFIFFGFAGGGVFLAQYTGLNEIFTMTNEINKKKKQEV